MSNGVKMWWIWVYLVAPCVVVWYDALVRSETTPAAKETRMVMRQYVVNLSLYNLKTKEFWVRAKDKQDALNEALRKAKAEGMDTSDYRVMYSMRELQD